MSVFQYNRKTVLADVKLKRSALPLISTSGCSCAESAYVANILKNIGMPYAAGMHAKKNGDWSSNDLYLHAKEEDEKLFPLLRKIAETLSDKEKIYLISEVDELEREHYDFVYPSVEKNEEPPEVPFQRHGAKEDLLIRKYANQLLAFGHALDKCSSCRTYAWDFSFQKPVFNNGTFHHPNCSLARVKVGVGATYDIANSKNTELGPFGKIVIGTALSGVSLAFGLPLAVAAVPLGLFTTYAAVSAFSKPKLRFLNVPLMLIEPSVEKFMDPIFLCNSQYVKNSSGKDIPTYNFLAPEWQAKNEHGKVWNSNPNGLAYMSNVPNNAEARIGAIRSLINGNKATSSARYKKRRNLEPFIKASEKELLKLGTNLWQTYNSINKGSAKVDEISSRYGISTSKIKDEALDIVKSGTGDSREFLDKAIKKWGPVAQGTVSGIQMALQYSATAGESPRAALVAAMRGIESIAGAIPVAGPFIALAASLAGNSWASAEKAAEEFCREDQQDIWKFYNRGIELEYPMPWHAADIFSDACPKRGGSASGWEPTLQQSQLRMVFAFALETFKALPPEYLAPLQEWWRLSVTHMSDPRVIEVFEALGWDSYGGTLASDEQVMLVAAPIAVANGLDVDTFAKALWNASPGWRHGTSGLHLTKEGGSYRAMNIGKATCDKGLYKCQCESPSNAWAVQYGVLASQAFELVRKMRPLTVKI